MPRLIWVFVGQTCLHANWTSPFAIWGVSGHSFYFYYYYSFKEFLYANWADPVQMPQNVCQGPFGPYHSRLFILRGILTNLDLVVCRLRYYCRNMLNCLKHFMTKKTLNEFKDSKIYFWNKFIICQLNMYLKVLLYYLRTNSLCYILSLVIKNGLLPFN